MAEKIKLEFSIPTYRVGYREITSERIDSTEFKKELVFKLRQAGIEDVHFDSENLLVGLTIVKGETLVVSCSRGLDMVALRIFMCLIVKYNSALRQCYYSCQWENVSASLSVHSEG